MTDENTVGLIELPRETLPTIQSFVSERAERVPIYFIHAIRPDSFPNSLLREDTNWQDALRVSLYFQPTLATSTVRWGNSTDNIVSPFGILLSNGLIESACHTDNATVPVSLRNRRARKIESLDQALINAGDINEFTIRSPQIAGFFVWGEQQLLAQTDKSKVYQGDIQRHVGEELGIPIYIFEKGRLYSARWDEKAMIFRPDKTISATEFLAARFSLSTAQNRKVNFHGLTPVAFRIRVQASLVQNPLCLDSRYTVLSPLH